MTSLKSFLTTDPSLLKDLFSSLDKALAKKQKNLSQIRFATSTKNGWIFFHHVSSSWDILEDVLHQMVKQHRRYTSGTIAELLSRLVNLSEKDFTSLRTAIL